MSTSRKNENTDPTRISDYVFTGESFTSSGEKIYLHMELLTEENTKQWAQYATQAKLIVSDTNGNDDANHPTLIYLAANIALDRDDETLTGKDKNCYENHNYQFKHDSEQQLAEVIANTGLAADEFKKIIQLLGRNEFNNINLYNSDKRMFVSKKDNLRVLARNSSGSANMDTIPEGTTKYIVYATKKPGFRIQDIPLKDRLSLGEFRAYYNNLVMCVGSNFKELTSFEDRGIFRNPFSVIANDYKGIAMIMHGFIAAVAERFFPTVNCMIVRPLPIMQKLICATLKPEEVTIKDMTFDVAQESLALSMNNMQQLDYPTNTILLDALVSLYRKSQTARQTSVYSTSMPLFQKVSGQASSHGINNHLYSAITSNPACDR